MEYIKRMMKIKKTNGLHKNDSRFKAIYQDYDWCYQKFMIEGLNHDEMAKEADCTKRVIQKWCVERHRLTQKYRQQHKQLNNMQEALIVGSLLGDGHIDKRDTQPVFIVGHAVNQKDYLYFKYDLMKDFCNISPSHIKGTVKYFPDNSKGYLVQDAYRFCTRIHDCFLEYRNMTIKNLLDKLNSFSLSIWILDDGHRGRSNWQVCVANFADCEKEYAMKMLRQKFNLDCYIPNLDNRYIYFKANSTRVIDDIILKEIPNNLDIIKYKITENNQIASPQKRAYINIDGEDILLTEYCEKNNLPYKSTWAKFKDEIKLVI